VLEIKNLSLSYDKKQIISNINLLIKESQIISLIGESGSGKSTIAHYIMKLMNNV